MTESVIEAEYLIKGAGAVGMAFADSLVTDSDVRVVIVDRNDRPGGHWNDAYPFVRLHQPSSTYGVNSSDLGSGLIDTSGLNAGFHELASGQEVLSHFDSVMQHRLIPCGRVRYFPMSELDDGGVITSLLSGRRMQVDAGRFVDATYSNMAVPSTHAPSYVVDPDVACVPVNDLPRVAHLYDHYVVVGAGKTGMDACIWLLRNGADPDRIRWIAPRDSWVLNRANVQPGEEFFARLCKSLADQVEAVVGSESIDDVFAHLERADELRRIDPNVVPEAYHCAILSDGELAELRRIADVIRLGRVVEITPDEIRLEQGSVPSRPESLYIDCSAAGIPGRPSTPVFDGDRITLQWVRTCQPTFSAAFIGHVESTFEDEVEKNRICAPISPPTVPRDWLRVLRQDLANRWTWNEYPQLQDWLAASRLDPFAKFARTRMGVDVEATAHIQRYLQHVARAQAKLDELLAV